MALRHQALIDEQELAIACPPADYKPNSTMYGARWVVAPIDSPLNFLPNHLHDLALGKPKRRWKSEMGCTRCGMSFYASVLASKTSFNALNPAQKSNLGYTHIAEGTIEEDWAIVSPINPVNQHFSVFETECADWLANFQITQEL